MGEAHEIERKAVEILKARLADGGRDVRPSDIKTFDLIVDGKYAEVKGKRKGFDEFDFFYATENQYRSVQAGDDCILFLICGTDDPGTADVFEIPFSLLREFPPKQEVKYYWNKGAITSALDSLAGGSG